jgi:hypothetical protein
MNKNTDIDRITDLCLNYKTPNMRLDDIEDQIRLLKLEITILTNRLNSLEDEEIERAY